MGMNADGLRDAFRRLAKASVVLGPEDAQILKKAAVVLQSFQEANVNTLTAKHQWGSRPLQLLGGCHFVALCDHHHCHAYGQHGSEERSRVARNAPAACCLRGAHF